MSISPPGSDLKRLIEEGQKRQQRNFRIRVAVTVLLIAGAVAYWFAYGRPDPRFAGIPPVKNADGTVDYTIRTWGDRSGIGGQTEDILWVLRLPQDAYVQDDWNDTSSQVSIPDGPTMTFNPRARNTWLTFYLNPETAELSKTLAIKDRNYLRVAANYTIWPLKDWKHVIQVTFESGLCKKTGEPVPGIEFYSAIDPGAYAQLQKQKPGQYLGHCQAIEGSEIFILRDQAGKPVGEGSCNDLRCDATFRMPSHREFVAHFFRADLQKLEQYRNTIISYLEKHTVRIDRYLGQSDDPL
jgi:hypothetical protein